MDFSEKYDIPAPRYTSYPTTPYWTDAPTTGQWLESIDEELAGKDKSWSLYVHIPFCESLCTFCGCHKTITKNHRVEQPYVDQVLREFYTYWDGVASLKDRPLRALHLGGGTPTFLSADNLKRLVEPIVARARLATPFEASIEVDPRRALKEQLQALRLLGFNRISLGVQDFNSEVQRMINRIQPFDITKRVFDWSRELGYESVNLDLIYGLPGQNLEFIERTVEQTLALRPDRIALYSFAMVPWLKPQQRTFKVEDVPVGKEKRTLYEKARSMLLAANYDEIGMDHFALKSDALAIASKNGTLHRNFMGYTDMRSDLLLGIGVSSISETSTCFHQNEKLLPQYERAIEEGRIPTFHGHRLSAEDRQHRAQILDLMTTGRVMLRSAQREDISSFLVEMVKDGLVKIAGLELQVTEAGKPFLRNVCMALDARMRAKDLGVKVFSQSV